MSDSKNRVLRAVRLLDKAVRIGRGGIEELEGDDAAAQSAPDVRVPDSEEKRALVAAEAEIRKLKGEIRDLELSAKEERDAANAARDELARARVEIDSERRELEANLEREVTQACENARREGLEAGTAQGYEEGIKKADSEKQTEYSARFNDALNMLSGMTKSLSEAREQLAAAHAPQLVRLWEIMLEKMLAVKVSIDTDAAIRIVDTILKRVSDRERVLVYLNPQDITMVESSKDSLVESIRGVKNFEMMSDDHVDRGSCLVETNMGIYDARWRTQLEQISTEVETLLMELMNPDA